MGILANPEDPNEIQYNAAFHHGQHCLLSKKEDKYQELI